MSTAWYRQPPAEQLPVGVKLRRVEEPALGTLLEPVVTRTAK